MGTNALRTATSNVPTFSTAGAPFGRLPVELLCYIARFSSYSDVCAAVNVCRRWRGTLLANTSLWTHVRVCLPSSSYARWLSTIRTLVGRSAGRPLTLELATEDRVQQPFGPKYVALESVALFLAEHMSVLVMLNLSIPTCVTPCWNYCLQLRAPLLRSFRLYNMTYFDSEPQLPILLFGGHAPHLETLCLEQAFLREDLLGSPALQNVTSLYYHNSHNSLHERDMLGFLDEFMPDLKQLTCTVLEDYGHDEFMYPHPVELRLIVAPRVSAMAARFPRATSVTYSYFYQNGKGSGLLAIVEEAIRAREPATSVSIAWAPGPRDMPYWFCTNGPEEHHAVTVNGRALIVDIHIDTLRAALTPAAVALLTAHVRQLSIVDTLWPVFATVAMPALEELTLYLRAGNEPEDDGVFHTKLPAPRPTLKALRFACTTGSRQSTPDLEVPATLIAAFIENTVALRSVPTVYLSGVRTVGDGNAALFGITEVIVHEPHDPVEALEQWSWELREEDALKC